MRGFYPIIDVSYTPEQNAYTLAEEILSSGVSLLQLRQKNLSESDFLKLAQQLYYLKIHNPFSLIINHFVDVAKSIDADGVHLSANQSLQEARAILGKNKLIGVSVHSIDEGIEREKEGADYLLFGAIYPTATKGADHPIQGINKLKELCSTVKIPVVAVGGITPERVSEVLSAGAVGFSAITAISQSKSPASISKQFMLAAQGV